MSQEKKTCGNCIFREAGFDGKPSTCNNPKMEVANIWDGFKHLKDDGIGYSDEQWSEELAQIYVGDNFGCIHFAQIP